VLKSAIWFITWKCNYKCPYCWEVQRASRGEIVPEPFIEYDAALSAWNTLRPEILDISGGEPFLFPRFFEMVNALDPSIKVAITTNLSKDITQFTQCVSPKRCFSMTLSYHPTQADNFDIFMGRCLMLKNLGYNITVNFVTWPEQLWLIPILKDRFENYGIRFHVDPYAQTEFYPYRFSDKERELVAQFCGEDRRPETRERYIACSGGNTHVVAFPDGEVYRCIVDKIKGLPSIGNLKTGFKLLQEWGTCRDWHICAGCDKDKVKVRDME
jgi:MoaA/NifB/PqqE/SkfB family radical SAM enzyme